jgi:D-alanine-D-alanine ligase
MSKIKSNNRLSIVPAPNSRSKGVLAGKRIAVLYTAPTQNALTPENERQAEDLTSNACAIARVLQSATHPVQCFEFGQDAGGLFSRLKAFRPDLVFNLAEAPLGAYEKEPDVPALLELLEYPYTGNGPVPLALCKDKAVTKHLLQAHGLPTPGFRVCHAPPRTAPPLAFPLIVKPLRQDGSQGMTEQSVVTSLAALRRSIAFVLETQHQSALVEEFVGGREFNVSILGNGTSREPFRVLPPGEYVYHDPRWRICTFEAKWDQNHPSYAAVEAVYPAKVPAFLCRRLERLCLRCAEIFQLSGYARMDLRLDHQGVPQILDINPNPDLAPGMGSARSAESAGMSYPDFIQEIVRLGWQKGAR